MKSYDPYFSRSLGQQELWKQCISLFGSLWEGIQLSSQHRQGSNSLKMWFLFLCSHWLFLPTTSRQQVPCTLDALATSRTHLAGSRKGKETGQNIRNLHANEMHLKYFQQVLYKLDYPKYQAMQRIFLPKLSLSLNMFTRCLSHTHIKLSSIM